MGGGGQVGLDDGEVGQSLQGSPAAAGCSLLDLDGSDLALGHVVGEGDGQVGGEPQDDLAVGVEPGVQGAGMSGQDAAVGGRLSCRALARAPV